MSSNMHMIPVNMYNNNMSYPHQEHHTQEPNFQAPHLHGFGIQADHTPMFAQNASFLTKRLNSHDFNEDIMKKMKPDMPFPYNGHFQMDPNQAMSQHINSMYGANFNQAQFGNNSSVSQPNSSGQFFFNMNTIFNQGQEGNNNNFQSMMQNWSAMQQQMQNHTSQGEAPQFMMSQVYGQPMMCQGSFSQNQFEAQSNNSGNMIGMNPQTFYGYDPQEIQQKLMSMQSNSQNTQQMPNFGMFFGAPHMQQTQNGQEQSVQQNPGQNGNGQPFFMFNAETFQAFMNNGQAKNGEEGQSNQINPNLSKSDNDVDSAAKKQQNEYCQIENNRKQSSTSNKNLFNSPKQTITNAKAQKQSQSSPLKNKGSSVIEIDIEGANKPQYENDSETDSTKTSDIEALPRPIQKKEKRSSVSSTQNIKKPFLTPQSMKPKKTLIDKVKRKISMNSSPSEAGSDSKEKETRRRNRWQEEKSIDFRELRLQMINASNYKFEDQAIKNLDVGPLSQVQIPELENNVPLNQRTRRTVKSVWTPEVDVESQKFQEFEQKIQSLLFQDVNQAKLIQIVKECQNNLDEAYTKIKSMTRKYSIVLAVKPIKKKSVL